MNKTIRCAIYTRKSSEEGLEQSFNSLDAQRDSCEAYIKSQVHEGWKVVSKHYDDGGFSGGTMNRPALQELLDDIKQNKIDIVIVYKVDRLTRSLMDFSKIVEVFDSHNVSFVSITQHFNTTTSMGRLTLNILLSFAQFEREVTGERIRDKFAASAKKGLWITGATPLGYKKEENKLIIDNQQSWKIIKIFEMYRQLRSVSKLKKYLDKEKVYTRSGKPFSKGNLYCILSNKVYLGKIVKKENIYEGQHEALISTDVFQDVQAILNENNFDKIGNERKPSNALLQGKLFDEFGNSYSTTRSTGRNGNKYFYYINQGVKQEKILSSQVVNRIPANEIEQFVKEKILLYMNDVKNLQSLVKDLPLKHQRDFLQGFDCRQFDDSQVRRILQKIVLYRTYIEIYLSEYEIYKIITNTENETKSHSIIQKFEVQVSNSLRKGCTMVIGSSTSYNQTLINAVVKGFYYNKMILENKNIPEIFTRNARRLRKLRFLPPDLIQKILDGKQDENLTVEKLINIAITSKNDGLNVYNKKIS